MVSETIICEDYREFIYSETGANLVNIAKNFKSEIFIEYNGKKINGKSLLKILSMNLSGGKEITISAEGVDEKEAVEALKNFLISLVTYGNSDMKSRILEEYERFKEDIDFNISKEKVQESFMLEQEKKLKLIRLKINEMLKNKKIIRNKFSVMQVYPVAKKTWTEVMLSEIVSIYEVRSIHLKNKILEYENTINKNDEYSELIANLFKKKKKIENAFEEVIEPIKDLKFLDYVNNEFIKECERVYINKVEEILKEVK